MQAQPYRISIQIRGFDVFVVDVRSLDGQLLGSIQYDAADFDDYIDLDSHMFDFLLTADGQLIRTSQQD
jgi:hypothetical protein